MKKRGLRDYPMSLQEGKQLYKKRRDMKYPGAYVTRYELASRSEPVRLGRFQQEASRQSYELPIARLIDLTDDYVEGIPCGRCTFLNDIDAFECAMCTFHLPIPNAYKRCMKCSAVNTTSHHDSCEVCGVQF
jgi:hypothetical protein